MKFHSIKDRSTLYSFEDALFHGFASDGSLLLPQTIPTFTPEELHDLPQMTLRQITTLTLSKWFGGSLTGEEIGSVVEAGLKHPLPLVKVGHMNIYEMFHGATYSYKDLPSSLFAQLMRIVAERSDKKVKVLIAASGYSAPSIAHAFADIEHMQVTILYSKKSISCIQKEMLTRVAPNVTAIEIDGSVDECHALVSRVYTDPEFKNYTMTTANSKNVGILLSTVLYFVYAYALTANRNPTFILPLGKYGKLSALLMAKKMGLPFGKVVIACPSGSNILRYSDTGKLAGLPFLSWLNKKEPLSIEHDFPRVNYFCESKRSIFLEHFEAVGVSDSKVTSTLHSIYHEYNYIMDPRTALTWAAADEAVDSGSNPVIFADGSPLKFASEIEGEIGIKLDTHHLLEKLHRKPVRKVSLRNNYASVKRFLLEHFQKDDTEATY